MNAVWAGVLPLFAAVLLLTAALRRKDAYTAFVQGARGGAGLCLKTLPHMLAMLVAAQVFERAGGFALLGRVLAPVLTPLGIPAAILGLVLTRACSGSGALGLLAGILSAYGPASREAYIACLYMGSADTLLYVLSLYAGAAGIRHTGYTLPCAAAADLSGLLFASLWTALFF